MPDFSAPLVLLALLLLPLLRLLHRRRAGESQHSVAALFLWPEEAEEGFAPKTSAEVDPRWWLRAAIAALLILGLAGPELERPTTRQIAIDFDDSPSMEARETSGPRFREAARVLAEAVAEVHREGDASVSLRSLANPQHRLALDDHPPEQLARAIENWVEVSPRPAALPALGNLPAGAEHWLVSDGANPAILTFARRGQLDRVLFVGAASENVGVTRLATRPQIAPKRGVAGIVQVHSAGRESATRRLRVLYAGREVLDEELVLAPGEDWQGSFELSLALTPRAGAPDHAAPEDSPSDEPDVAALGPLRAELSPADVLVSDDVLELDSVLSPRRSAFVDSRCDRNLNAAMRAHPALEIVATRDAFLTLWCGSEAPPPETRALWFRPGNWKTTARMQRSPRQVEIRRNMQDPDWVRAPGYIAYLSDELDRLAGEPLLERGRALSLGAPGPTGALEEERVDSRSLVSVAPARPTDESGDSHDIVRARSIDTRSDTRSDTQSDAASDTRDLAGLAAVMAALLLLVDIRWVSRRGAASRRMT